jgi:hypothetical protein
VKTLRVTAAPATGQGYCSMSRSIPAGTAYPPSSAQEQTMPGNVSRVAVASTGEACASVSNANDDLHAQARHPQQLGSLLPE